MLQTALYRTQHMAMLASTTVIIAALHKMLAPRHRISSSVRQALGQRFDALLREDLRNVEAGRYPRELLFQVPFKEWALQFPEALRELPRFVARSRRRGHDELPDDVDRSDYPDYYLRNFHWQTDGWFSPRSARLYDYEVELLFGGVADVMRRQSIPPVVDGTADCAHPRVLDLGIGTGRFLHALSQALPRAKLFGVDLSRAYLDHAGRLLAGHDVNLVRENAEALPFKDETFDAVTSQFLFHELPKDARARIHAEAYRVLCPGRRYVVLDAAQRGDGDEIMGLLETFPQLYHEPYFLSHLGDPLEEAIERAGFVIESTASKFTGKQVVAKKPA